MAAETTIVIPVWNQLAFTQLCLDSLKAHTPAGSYDVVVVDNGSTDGTGEYLQAFRAPGFTVISNPQNLGCAPAWNQGVKAAPGSLVVIANNDLVFAPGWLEGLKTGMDRHGLGMGEPLCREGAMDYDLPAVARESVARNKGKTSLDVIGYCMAFRREVFDKVGLFDESFAFGKGEDKDFQRRMKEKGLTYAQVGDSFVHHFGSVTINVLKETMPGFEERNLDYFRGKWGADLEQKPGPLTKLKRSWTKFKRSRGWL